MVSTPTTPHAAESPRAAEPSLRRATVSPGVIEPLCLRLPGVWKLTEEAFIELSDLNPIWQIETTEEGELLIMPGEGMATSEIGIEIATDLAIWNRLERQGTVLGASGAVRHSERHIMIPDVSWISREREESAKAQVDTILVPTCPEFVVEIRSRGQSLTKQREKMEQWLRHGALLGWLVDPQEGSVWIYRPDTEPQRSERPEELSGEDVCEGLVVDFARIWASEA